MAHSSASAAAHPASGSHSDDRPVPLTQEEARDLLDRLDQQIEQVVLSRQHPISGLLPASTASTVHGNYGDAWVRDCVYSIQCVWGLAMAYRRLHGPCRRAHELEQRVLQLMRGLLNAMLRQAEKVERFKSSLDPLDAIHAKFDTASGDPVVPDDGWGHLQLDATALFLLQLAQLTRSGLVVVQTSPERDFIQNLTYYVARAYRVADYGIWERGDKGNHGLPERNASSIGLVKAALEALEGLDLLHPHHPSGRHRAVAPCVAQLAAAGVSQQGGGQRLLVGDRLSRLGGGRPCTGGPDARQDPQRAGRGPWLQALPPRWAPVRDRGRDTPPLRA
jgi:phosphorylase kinase alpha/beta subunit